MNIILNIAYCTRMGEELVLHSLTRSGEEDVHRMSTFDGEQWHATLEADPADGEVNYFYALERAGKELRREWTLITHRLDLSATKATDYLVFDYWVDIPEDAYLYTSAYTDCIHPRTVSPVSPSAYDSTLRMAVRAPQLLDHQRLTLVGSAGALGCWNPRKAIPMTEHNHNEWVVDVDANALGAGHHEFKFVAFDERQPDVPVWETGCNHSLDLSTPQPGQVRVHAVPMAFFPICDTRLAGTLVPVFSLRSAASFGVGDFGDLKKMIDLVARTGQRVLQILPVNDTTLHHNRDDSYPYSCISVFALHPQYVDLTQLPPLKDAAQRKHYETVRQRLNALPQIDYEEVMRTKMDYLRLLFEQEGQRTLRSSDFKEFFDEANPWLVPYAAYATLRDRYGTPNFREWPDHNLWDETWRDALTSTRTRAYRDVSFWYYVQFVLSRQLGDAHCYARQQHVILKGDIPIGVNREGCDVWTEPKYFNLNGQAGAPPDAFSVNGQNWGFPTYNWDEMLKDGCLWWKRRFQNMARYFDAYRIDHVLGFFRIWEIPVSSVHGLLGQFQPALAMTSEEIESYGLPFHERLYCEPLINDELVKRLFGDQAETVKGRYLMRKDADHWELRPEFATQRSVEGHFWQLKENVKATVNDDQECVRQCDRLDRMRDGIYTLISNVLFLRDHKNISTYHPRIAAQNDYAYATLSDSDKAAFNRIHEDYFYHRNNHFWYHEAMRKLPRLVQATRMLVCAEDLGMVPACVPWVMNELKILTLEIQSMPKEAFVRFSHPEHNPYRSVCTFSTHDMATLRQWWDEDPQRTQEYYNVMMHHEGAAPHPLSGSLAREVVAGQLGSSSMLCVLSIQDWLAISERLRLVDPNAERINIPANPHHYWRYRMHLNIEDLACDKQFVDEIRNLVKHSGR